MDSILILALVLLIIYVFTFTQPKKHSRKRNTPSSDIIAENLIDDGAELNYSHAYQPKWIFTYHEKDFYYKLKEFADRHGLYLFAKVRLLDLVEPRKNQKRYKTYFYKVQAKHVDFVLCNEKLVAKWIIELDDASHQQKDRINRDLFVDEVLKSAGYIILHMDDFNEIQLENALYDSAEERSSTVRT